MCFRRSRVTVVGSGAGIAGSGGGGAAMEGWDGFPAFGTRPNMARADYNDATDVLIENKTFESTAATLAALRFINCTNVMVRECDFLNVPGGVFGYLTEVLTLRDCRFQNITGPHERLGNNVGNLIQVDTCDAVLVSHNKGKGGDTEDVISFYKTDNSTAEDNWFEMFDWESPSGSGIALSDDGGDGNIARRNILINPGQVGIFITSGVGNAILENIVIGEQRTSSNVGMYVNRVYPPPCSDHLVDLNRVLWKNAAGANNSFWNSGNCGPLNGGEDPDNIFDDTTLDIEDYRVTL